METSVQTNFKRKRSSEKHANPLRAQVLCISRAASSCPVKAFLLAHRNHHYSIGHHKIPPQKSLLKTGALNRQQDHWQVKKMKVKRNQTGNQDIISKKCMNICITRPIEKRKNGLQMRKEAEREDERYKEYA